MRASLLFMICELNGEMLVNRQSLEAADKRYIWYTTIAGMTARNGPQGWFFWFYWLINTAVALMKRSAVGC